MFRESYHGLPLIPTGFTMYNNSNNDRLIKIMDDSIILSNYIVHTLLGVDIHIVTRTSISFCCCFLTVTLTKDGNS